MSVNQKTSRRFPWQPRIIDHWFMYGDSSHSYATINNTEVPWEGGTTKISSFCLCSSRILGLLLIQLMQQWLPTPLLLSFSPQWWVDTFLCLKRNKYELSRIVHGGAMKGHNFPAPAFIQLGHSYYYMMMSHI